MRKHLCILLIFFACFSYAQPGGGGGLKIYNLFDSDSNHLSIRKGDVKVRAFVLGYCLYSERTPISHEIELSNSDTISLTEESDLRLYYTLSQAINLRLLILYKSDTCMYDFYNVQNSNAGGNYDQIDSLFVRAGYTSHSRISGGDSIIHTFKPKISIPFFNVGTLPQTFYYEKGEHALRKNDFSSAVKYLLQASETKNAHGIIEQHWLPGMYNSLATAYYNLGEYIKAEEFSGKAVLFSTYNYEFYKTRIQILIKLNKLDEALKNYYLAIKNVHSSSSNVEEWIRTDWALFNINYLHEYDTVIHFYQRDIERAEKQTYLYNSGRKLTDFPEHYFMLGCALYGKGNLNAAYELWLRSFELGNGDVNHAESVHHFDSIYQLHPDQPLPNLLKAIALYKSAPYMGGGQLEKTLLDEALTGILVAEKLIGGNYTLNFWKAKILYGLSRYEESLKAINAAIETDSINTLFYEFRSGLWSNTGSANYLANAENDWHMAQKQYCLDQYRPLNMQALAGNGWNDLVNCISVETFYSHWKDALPMKMWNDSVQYFYCDSTVLFCEGVYKELRQVIKRGKYFFTEPEFKQPKREVVYTKFRFGTWKYYDINGSLLLESNYKLAKKWSWKNNKTVPCGTWKYYKGGVLIREKHFDESTQE